MSKLATSELEARASKARETLETLTKAGIVIEGITLAEVKKTFKFSQSNGEIVCVINEKAKGDSKMVQIAWGVKANVMINEAGAAVINAFVFDADRYSEEKAAQWIQENRKSLEESYAKIQESLPAGSFEDITCKLYDAIRNSNYFPMSNDGMVCWYVVCVFPDRCIVQCGEQAYQIGYTNQNNVVSLGEPVKVTTEFVTQECAKAKETAEALTVETEKLTLKEVSSTDTSNRELIAVLIEEGVSVSKNRYYPASALKEAAPLFAGLKNYIDHPTAEEERSKPERSIKDWVSTIQESWYEEGKIMGKIKIHDDWLWEKIQDPVFRENIGLSINANGKRTIKEVGGKPMEVIEKIFAPKSVDWVTEPGARGRVAHLLESARNNQGENDMLKTVKLEEVKAERPDLINLIEAETRAKVEAEQAPIIEAKIKEAVAPLQAKIDEMTTEKVKLAESAKVKELVGASKLPKAAQTKVIAEMTEKVFGDEAKLIEAVNAKIKSELEYLKETVGIKIGMGSETPKKGELSEFEKAVGLKEIEKK